MGAQDVGVEGFEEEVVANSAVTRRAFGGVRWGLGE